MIAEGPTPIAVGDGEGVRQVAQGVPLWDTEVVGGSREVGLLLRPVLLEIAASQAVLVEREQILVQTDVSQMKSALMGNDELVNWKNGIEVTSKRVKSLCLS